MDSDFIPIRQQELLKFEDYLSSVEDGDRSKNSLQLISLRRLSHENIENKINPALTSPEPSSNEVEVTRCIVCTLPLGRCIHSKDWLMHSLPQEFSFEPEIDDVQQEVDDVLGFLGDEVKLDLPGSIEDVDLDCISWISMLPRPSDKIGDSDMILSAPSMRGWHSSVTLKVKQGESGLLGFVIAVFGGFRFRSTVAPQPFVDGLSIGTTKDCEYLNELCLFDTYANSWHLPKPLNGQLWPSPRYGNNF